MFFIQAYFCEVTDSLQYCSPNVYIRMFRIQITSVNVISERYSGTSLLRSPMELGKSDLNGEVTILQMANVLFFALWNTIRD